MWTAAAGPLLLLLLPVLTAESPPSSKSSDPTSDLLRQLRRQAGEFGDEPWPRSATSDDTRRLRRYLRDYISLLARHGVRESEQVRALVTQHAALLPAVLTQPEALRPLLLADGARRLSMYNLLDAEIPLLGQPEPQPQRQPPQPPRQQEQQQTEAGEETPSRVVVFSAYNEDVPEEVREKLSGSDAPLGEGELDGLLLELLQAAAHRHETLNDPNPTAPGGTGESAEESVEPATGDRIKKGIVSVSKKDSQTSYIIYPDRQPAAVRPNLRRPQQRLDDSGFQTINAQVQRFDRNRQSLVTSQGVPGGERATTPPPTAVPPPPTEQPSRQPRPQRRPARPTRRTRRPSNQAPTEGTTSRPAQTTAEAPTPIDRVRNEAPEVVTIQPQSEVEARSTTRRLVTPGDRETTEQTGQSVQYNRDYPQDDELLQYYYDDYQEAGGDYQSGPGDFRPAQDYRPAQEEYRLPVSGTEGGTEPPFDEAGLRQEERPVVPRPAVIKSSVVIIPPPPEPPKGDANQASAVRYTATPPAMSVSQSAALSSSEEPTQNSPERSTKKQSDDTTEDATEDSSDAASGGLVADQPEISPDLQAFLTRFEQTQEERGDQQVHEAPQRERTGMSTTEGTQYRHPGPQPVPTGPAPIPASDATSRRPDPQKDIKPPKKYPKDPWELFNALFEDDPTEPPPTTTPAPTRQPSRRPMPSLSDLLIPLLTSYHRFQQVSLGEQRPSPRPTPAGPLGQIPLLVPPQPPVHYAPTPPQSPQQGILAHRLGRPQSGGGRPRPGGGRPNPGGGDGMPQIQTIPLSSPQLRLPKLPPPFGVVNGAPVRDGSDGGQAIQRPEGLGGGRPWSGPADPNRPDPGRPWHSGPVDADRRRPPMVSHGPQNRVGAVAEPERPPMVKPGRPSGQPNSGTTLNGNRRRPRPRPAFPPETPQGRPQPVWLREQNRPWSGNPVQDDAGRPRPELAPSRDGDRPQSGRPVDRRTEVRPGIRPGMRPDGRPGPRLEGRPGGHPGFRPGDRPPEVLAGMRPPLDLAAHWRPDASEKTMMLATRPPPPGNRPELPIRGHFPYLLQDRDGPTTNKRPANDTAAEPGRRPTESTLNGVPLVQLRLPQFLAGLQGLRPVPPHLAPPPPRLPLGPQLPGPPPPLRGAQPPHGQQHPHGAPPPPHGQLGTLLRRPPPQQQQPQSASLPQTPASTEHPAPPLTRAPPPPVDSYFPGASPTQPADYNDYDDIITAAAPLPDLNEIGAPAQTTTEKDLETLGAIVSSVMNRRPNRTEQAAIDRNVLRKRIGMAAVGGGGGGYDRYDVHEQSVNDRESIAFEEWQPPPTSVPTSSQRPATRATSRPVRPSQLPHPSGTTQPPRPTRLPQPTRPTRLPRPTRPTGPTQRTRRPRPMRPHQDIPTRPTLQPVTRPTTIPTPSITSSQSTSTTDIALLAEVPSQGPALDRSNAVPGHELPGNSTDDAPSQQVKSGGLSSEEIAYILIGTTAGLSVFCLVIVAITMKCKRNCSVYALLSRLMHSEYIQGLGSRMSSARSHRSAAGGGADAPTHKLGSWFNGRSESLGGAEKFRSNMALPVGYSSNISCLGVKQSKPHGYSVRRLSVPAGQLISSTSSSGESVADTSDQETLGGRREGSGSEGGRAASRGTSWLHGSYVFGGGEMRPRPGPSDGPVQGVMYRRSSDELPPTPAAAAAAASDAITSAAASTSAAETRRSRRRAPSGSQQMAPPSRRGGSSRHGSRRGHELTSRGRQQEDSAAEASSRSPRRHRSRSRAGSPEPRSRHRSHSRARSPEHRGRHRSHSRARSPDRHARHRSHSRARSPDRHVRHRSQSRARSPERRSRRSLSRASSPAMAAAVREAVRRSPSEPRQQRRRPRDSSRPREVSEHRASLRHVRTLTDALSDGSNSAVNWSSSDERLI